MEASCLSATRWHNGGLQGALPEGLWRLSSSETNPLSPWSDLFPLIFCFTDSGLQLPPWCLHTASSNGTASAGHLVLLGGYWRQAFSVLTPPLLPRVQQRPTKGPLDVHRRPTSFRRWEADSAVQKMSVEKDHSYMLMIYNGISNILMMFFATFLSQIPPVFIRIPLLIYCSLYPENPNRNILLKYSIVKTDLFSLNRWSGTNRHSCVDPTFLNI